MRLVALFGSVVANIGIFFRDAGRIGVRMSAFAAGIGLVVWVRVSVGLGLQGGILGSFRRILRTIPHFSHPLAYLLEIFCEFIRIILT